MNQLRHTLFIPLVLSLLPVTTSYGQRSFVNDLVNSMVAAGFELNELDKLKMGQLLAAKKVVTCQVKNWARSVNPLEMTESERKTFLTERAMEFAATSLWVHNKLKKIGGGDNRQTQNFAYQIARDNDVDVIVNKVLPRIEKIFASVNDEQTSAIEALRIASADYQKSIKSLCEQVNGLDDRVKRLENTSGRMSNSVLERPNVNRQNPSPYPANPMDYTFASNTSGVIYPDRIVNDRSVLCASARMIRKCYDYTPLQEINGQLRRGNYHGNLYEDCQGYILVTHPKQPVNAVGGQFIQGQPYPGQTYPGQTYPGQTYPGQTYPGQTYPGQTYPGQTYPGQTYPAQVIPGQVIPGQTYPVQGYPVQGYPVQGYPGQVIQGPAYPVQYPGHVYPGQTYTNNGRR